MAFASEQMHFDFIWSIQQEFTIHYRLSQNVLNFINNFPSLTDFTYWPDNVFCLGPEWRSSRFDYRVKLERWNQINDFHSTQLTDWSTDRPTKHIHSLNCKRNHFMTIRTKQIQIEVISKSKAEIESAENKFCKCNYQMNPTRCVQ